MNEQRTQVTERALSIMLDGAVGAVAGAICGAAYGFLTNDLLFCAVVGLPFGGLIGLLLGTIGHPRAKALPHSRQ